MQNYKNDLWEEVQADPPAFSWPGDPALDADMAYRLYMYYGNCSVLSSRGDHIDQQIDKIASQSLIITSCASPYPPMWTAKWKR